MESLACSESISFSLTSERTQVLREILAEAVRVSLLPSESQTKLAQMRNTWGIQDNLRASTSTRLLTRTRPTCTLWSRQMLTIAQRQSWNRLLPLAGWWSECQPSSSAPQSASMPREIKSSRGSFLPSLRAARKRTAQTSRQAYSCLQRARTSEIGWKKSTNGLTKTKIVSNSARIKREKAHKKAHYKLVQRSTEQFLRRKKVRSSLELMELIPLRKDASCLPWLSPNRCWRPVNTPARTLTTPSWASLTIYSLTIIYASTLAPNRKF